MADVNYDGERALEVAQIIVSLCNSGLGSDLMALRSAIGEQQDENVVTSKITQIAADYNSGYNIYAETVNEMRDALKSVEGMEEYFRAAEKRLLGNVKADTSSGGKIKGFKLGHEV